MPDQNKSKPTFTDTLANLVSDVVSDANLELVQKAWFGNPITYDGRMSDYYQTPLTAKEEPAANGRAEVGSGQGTEIENVSEIDR